jgi:hypothetical protein
MLTRPVSEAADFAEELAREPACSFERIVDLCVVLPITERGCPTTGEVLFSRQRNELCSPNFPTS